MNRLLRSRWALPIAFLAVALALWEGADLLGLTPRTLLPPSELATAVYEVAAAGELLPAVAATVRRQFSGFLVGSSLGIIFGLVAGLFRWAEDVFDTLVSVSYPVPKIALFPIAILWFGFSDTSRILIIAMTCFYPTFINSLAGTRGLNERMIWVARNVGAGKARILRQVVFRAVMPSIAVGIRISLALSFVLAWATETIYTSGDGLGNIIDDGFRNLQYGPMYAGIVAFAVLGLAADAIWVRLSRPLLAGQETMAVGRG